MSEKRLEKKRHDEEIEHILNESVISNQATSDQPSTSSMDNETSATVKRKRLNNRELKTGKKRKENVSPSTRDVWMQVSPHVLNKEVECSISIDQVPTDKCANCFARENPAVIMCDHLYSTNDQNKLHETDTHSMQNKEEFLLNMSDEKTNEDIDECMCKTPEKEYNDDPTYVPSDSDISPQKSSPPNARVKFNQFVNDKKFIVFYSCLKILFAMLCCNTCSSIMDQDEIQTRFDGTCLVVTLICMQGHVFKWTSQPFIGQQPVGNILITAASAFSGNTYSKMQSFSDTIKLLFISKTSYHKIESELIIPTIDRFWTQQKGIILHSLQNVNLVVSADGRCDSPGFSAKYCTYTIMECKTNAVIEFNVVQVTESNNSSSRMELTGFQRTMQYLVQSGIKIVTIATDRHVQIRKEVKDNYPGVNHQFDVWHLAKSIKKKLVAIAKKKGNEELMSWVKSVGNHLWYCASQCNGDADLLREMWVSIINHIQNIHTFEGENFLTCGHATLSSDEMRKKKWLCKDSKPLKALKDVVCAKRLLKDIGQLSFFCHTGDLEIYHSMMLKYVPKRQAFRYPQMVARTQLAALDHNFNLNRKVAVDADGQERFGVMCPKATGRWSVRKLFVAKTYDFRDEMMTMLVERKHSKEKQKTPHQEKARMLPKNISKVPAPSKSELLKEHTSRFKKD